MTIYQQELRCLMAQGFPPSVDPREQLQVSLAAFIKSKQEQHHEIVVMIDANEAPGTPNGAIQYLIDQCQLWDVIEYRFPLEQSPSPYHRGRHRIDYVLASTQVIDTVTSVSILPVHYELESADHRAILVDFCSEALLACNRLNQSLPIHQFEASV